MHCDANKFLLWLTRRRPRPLVLASFLSGLFVLFCLLFAVTFLSDGRAAMAEGGGLLGTTGSVAASRLLMAKQNGDQHRK